MGSLFSGNPSHRLCSPECHCGDGELGIDLSSARSKSIDEFRGRAFDAVLTVCDDAAEECPIWLGLGQRVHIGFPDPAQGLLEQFRAVRDEIRRKVIPFLDSFDPQATE